MRPKRVTVVGTGSSLPVPINQYSDAPSIGVGVKVTGTVNYTVEHTFDDVFVKGFDPTTAVWYPHATLAAQTTNKDGNYFAFPTAIRLTNNSGTGTSVMTLTPAGS